MRPALKTACLLFFLVFISPLFAEPEPEPEPAPQPSPQGESSLYDDAIFFIEELFTYEEAFSLDNSFTSEETSPDEEMFPEGEVLLGFETLPDEDSLPDGEIPPGEKTFAVLQPDTQGEGAQEGADEGSLYDEETLLADEMFLDDDALFFEAPPMIFEVPVFEMRSLDEIFPNLSRLQRIIAMNNGVLKNSFVKGESPMFVPNPDFGIDLLGSVMRKNPSHLIEALALVQYTERELDLLDIYNAVGRIEKIKDYPAYFNDTEFYAFTESTRIESARNRRAISDPSPAVTLPFSETIFLRIKEYSFGNLFIRGDISISMYGITYSMTNFTDVRYFLVPIMRAERFSAIIYLEPVKEGILIYSMSGFYIPDFIADKVNLTPSINRRIEVFINWITDGLRKQEGEEERQ